MIKEKMKGITVIEMVLIVAVVGILAAIFITPPFMCKAKWEQSGMASDFGYLKGCLVEVEPGRWIPSNRVRDLEVRVKPNRQ